MRITFETSQFYSTIIHLQPSSNNMSEWDNFRCSDVYRLAEENFYSFHSCRISDKIQKIFKISQDMVENFWIHTLGKCWDSAQEILDMINDSPDLIVYNALEYFRSTSDGFITIWNKELI